MVRVFCRSIDRDQSFLHGYINIYIEREREREREKIRQIVKDKHY
jgi:hypothetical protein